MKKKSLILFAVLILSSFYTCSDPLGPGLVPTPYMSLSIGDERQIMSFADSSTIHWVVTDTLRRSDGQLVFQMNWYYGTGTLPNIQYFLIKDGFFKSTALDTLRDTTFYVIGSYFGEQALAKVYPINGETWTRKFCINGDTLTNYFSSRSKDSLTIPAGTFYDCFQFVGDFSQSVYYANNIGYIATSINDTLRFVATYLKINGKEYGAMVPPKNSSEWWKNKTTDIFDFAFWIKQ